MCKFSPTMPSILRPHWKPCSTRSVSTAGAHSEVGAADRIPCTPQTGSSSTSSRRTVCPRPPIKQPKYEAFSRRLRQANCNSFGLPALYT